MIDAKKELLQTIEEFNSNGIDISQYFIHSLLIFNRRNIMLYVEPCGNDISIFTYQFVVVGHNLEYSDQQDLINTHFPSFIEDNKDDEIKNDAKKNFQYLLAILALRENINVFIDNDNVIYEDGYFLSNDRSILFMKANDICKKDIECNIKAISKYAYLGDMSISSLHNFKNLQYIYDGAFYACKKLEEISQLSNLCFLDQYAFCECSNIHDVNLSNSSLSCIGVHSFDGCLSLKNVYFPSTISSLGYFSFNNCKHLQQISIVGHNSEIEILHAFENCSELTNIMRNEKNIINNYLSGQMIFTKV